MTTGIRKMYTRRALFTELDTENELVRRDGVNHQIWNFPVLVMTPEAAERIFQAARKVYSSGEGTNSYEYESAEDFIKRGIEGA